MPGDPNLLDRVAAELEIRNVIARLAQTADAGAPEEYVALFADDAVWEMPANPVGGLPASSRAGTADILTGVHERRRAGLQGPGTATRHLVTTVSVDVECGDTATARSYWSFWADTATAPAVRSLGEYHDRFRRTADGWRLAHRTVVIG